MSFRTLHEHEENSIDILPPSGHELHAKAQEHDHKTDSDRVSKVQQAIPKHLPWYGLGESNSPKADATNTSQNMDEIPVEYELHSNTKTHQRGGVYESYSTFKQQRLSRA